VLAVLAAFSMLLVAFDARASAIGSTSTVGNEVIPMSIGSTTGSIVAPCCVTRGCSCGALPSVGVVVT